MELRAAAADGDLDPEHQDGEQQAQQLELIGHSAIYQPPSGTVLPTPKRLALQVTLTTISWGEKCLPGFLRWLPWKTERLPDGHHAAETLLL